MKLAKYFCFLDPPPPTEATYQETEIFNRVSISLKGTLYQDQSPDSGLNFAPLKALLNAPLTCNLCELHEISFGCSLSKEYSKEQIFTRVRNGFAVVVNGLFS